MINKKKGISIGIILLLISSCLVYAYLSLKVAKNLTIKSGAEVTCLNDDMRQIYVIYDEDSGWMMTGYNGYYFNENYRSKIVISGNFPKKLNNNVKNGASFILDGHPVEERNRDSNGDAFYVEHYDLLQEFCRDHPEWDYNKSGKYLSLSDFGGSEHSSPTGVK